MIVVGVDPHKHTHTAVAVSRTSAELKGELTVKARAQGHEELLAWARERGGERLFALEDCRHVSGALERFLIGHGERVVRVPPKLMGQSRKAARSYGKSDAIDALAVARAALSEPELPEARLAGPELELKLLLDHRDDLVGEANRTSNRLRWHLHDIDPEIALARGRLDRTAWMERLGRRLSRREQTVRVRICREQLRRLKALAREIKAAETELGALVSAQAPKLLELPGCGTLSAAKLIAEVAGVERFGDEAKLAMLAGGGAVGRLLGAPAAPSPEPQGQPAAEPGPAPDRRHPGPRAPAGEGLPGAKARRGQGPTRGASLPQAPPRPLGLAHPARRRLLRENVLYLSQFAED